VNLEDIMGEVGNSNLPLTTNVDKKHYCFIVIKYESIIVFSFSAAVVLCMYVDHLQIKTNVTQQQIIWFLKLQPALIIKNDIV